MSLTRTAASWAAVACAMVCKGAAAAALTPGNLVVANFSFAMLTEVTPTQTADSEPVQYLGLPAAIDPDVDRSVRGVAQADDGNLYIYRGGNVAAIQQLNPITGAVKDIAIAGFGTYSGYTYGDIAAYKNQIFATDMDSTGFPKDAPNGLVRYNTNDGTVTRFAAGHDYTNLTVGLNGMLYAKALGSSVLDVYDAQTSNLLGSVTLATSAQLNSFVVDSKGRIYASSYDSAGGKSQILSFDRDGQLLGAAFTLPLITDMAINDQGQIAIAAARNGAWLTDTSLLALQPFATLLPDSMSLTFVRDISSVPEGGTQGLMGVGLVGVWIARRSRSRDRMMRA